MQKFKTDNLDTDEIKKMEKKWRNSSPKFSDKELLEIFPEAKKIIPEKIVELKKQKTFLIKNIKKFLALIKRKKRKEFSKWFWQGVIKWTFIADLIETEKEIKNWERLERIAENREEETHFKGKINQEMIDNVLTIPIEQIASSYGIKLRKSGKNLIGLCPFHQEKHPSFFIYPESNSFYCFGCQRGGNIIIFIELLYGYRFPEAVKWLIKEK